LSHPRWEPEYRLKLVGELRSEMLGRSVVVAPGALDDGRYAVVDLHRREVAFEELVTAAA
jgi:Icc-related predicted phosphoesterase